MTSLSQKSINNSLTRANSSEIAGFAMPSNSKVEHLTLGSSGSKYTAPANGYFTISKGSGGANYMKFHNTTNNLTIQVRATSSSQDVECFIPCLKGQEIEIKYNASGTVYYFDFIYAEGE